MSDTLIRERTGGVPVPEFNSTPFVKPPALKDATVAIITTAGLQRPGEKIWANGDQSFRIFASHERNLTISHLSNNFDRSGLVADINVAFPVDRLQELADEGVIGAVAPRHLSFMGALDETMETLRQDTGPAAASLLRADGVQIAMLTPV